MTDFTNPSTVDVDEVISNINHAFGQRGSQGWDASWPSVTVKALADEVVRLRSELCEAHVNYINYIVASNPGIDADEVREARRDSARLTQLGASLFSDPIGGDG